MGKGEGRRGEGEGGRGGGESKGSGRGGRERAREGAMDTTITIDASQRKKSPFSKLTLAPLIVLSSSRIHKHNKKENGHKLPVQVRVSVFRIQTINPRPHSQPFAASWRWPGHFHCYRLAL